jgi:arginine deiminase
VQVLYLSELLQDVLEYAAAQATGLDRFKLVETGLGPAADREQWDDTGNLLVLAPGVVASYERNVATHARLEKCGIEVITVPGSELCGARGGPRSLCCPVSAIRRRFRVIYTGTS